MSNQVPQIFRTTYENNLKLALQQKESKLLRTVTDKDLGGEIAKLDDLIGAVDYYEKTERHSDTKYVDTPHDGRFLAAPDPIVYADLIDKEDKLKAGIEFEGAYVQAGAAALNRGVDAAIIRGIFLPAQTGKKGTILTPFDNSNIVPVNTGPTTGLNIAKLNAAAEILRAGDVDMDGEEFFMPITARQNSNLLMEIQTVNKDYGATGAEIADGRVRKLFGFNFVHIELGNPRFKDAAALTLDSNNYRKVPFYTKSGIVAGFWERLFSNVERLPTKHYSTQVYARRMVAATRLDEAKVGYILCQE